MKLFHNRFFFLSIILANCFIICQEIPQQTKELDFVYLHEAIPSIQLSPRYYSDENFVGTRIDGYKKPVIMITRQAADALKKVQEDIAKDGYELVIYDGYRPQKAVNHFMRWSKDTDECKKPDYYPYVEKTEVFKLGYIAEKSGHSRGSTVDLTLIKKGEKVQPISKEKRTLADGSTIIYLNDGTIDMGSSFDLFDEASHAVSPKKITKQYQELRNYFREKMEKNGFKHYSEEWWHFTLAEEPNTDKYLDRDVE